MKSQLASRNIVLLGIGHTNAHILKMWRMDPIDDAQLICISNFPAATYSGMFPGVLAGQYTPSQMQIDLVRLCKSVKATLIVDVVSGLDLEQRQVLFTERAPLPFDVLSIGIGSVPSFANVDVSQSTDRLVAIKPMQSFLARLDGVVLRVIDQVHDRPLRIAIVGAGVGGSEIAMCLPSRLRHLVPTHSVQIKLINAQPEILPGLGPSTIRRVRRIMEARGYEIVTGARVTKVDSEHVLLDNGQAHTADIVIWATGAVAAPLLSQLGLATDERGFIFTRRSLQVLDDQPIFVVGDSGTIQVQPTPKAGVYAVRQGPVLWDNLRRLLDDQPLVDYRPQTGFLKLMNAGDGTAIGQYKGWSFRGRWAWHWKDHIDRKFMAMFQDYGIRQMPAAASTPTLQSRVMRCAGCGGKVSGRVLSEAIRELSIAPRAEVVVGLDQPDDAAVLDWNSPTYLTVTTDFFQLPLDDPFVSGRIAALNALSDVWAMGASPVVALASVVLPAGSFIAQKRFLSELLAGGVLELQRASTTLVGGHTIEGEAPIFGFTILARQPKEALTAKKNLRSGDRLILSKPLGSGILLAAHMQARCEASWMQELLTHLLQSNQSASAFAAQSHARSVTDVTGFGLAGHIVEMINASNLDARLELSQIGLMKGVRELLEQGVESTLAPANRDVELQMVVTDSKRRSAEYAALFDPQTNGGLLVALGEQEFAAAQNQLDDLGFTMIGRVEDRSDDQPRLHCG